MTDSAPAAGRAPRPRVHSERFLAAARWRLNSDLARERLAIGLVVALAAALRFYDLDRTSLWYDEAASWGQAILPFREMLAATAQDNYPPLHNIILHGTILLFGDSETALRLPSAVLGTWTVYLIYRLGKELWDGWTGVIAALLLALSAFHIWFSQEARMYALLACTATLFVLMLLRAARQPTPLALALSALSGTALLYSHAYGPLISGAVNLVVFGALVARIPSITIGWPAFLASQAASALLFLPWAIILYGRATRIAQGFWIPEPTIEFVGETLARLAGNWFELCALAILAGLSFVWRSPFRRLTDTNDVGPAPTDGRFPQVLVATWLLGPILAGYAISILVEPIFYHRYLIGSLPALYLLAARGVMALRFNRQVLGLALLALVIGAIPAVWIWTFHKTRDDFRGATALYQAQSIAGDQIVVFKPNQMKVFNYYHREPLANYAGPLDPAEIEVYPFQGERLWLLFSHAADHDEAKILARVKQGYDQLSNWEFTDVEVYLFARTDMR